MTQKNEEKTITLPINKLCDKNKINEIIITIEIGKGDVNKNIYFLDNTDYIDEDSKINHFHDNLKELNKLNTELFINDKKYEFQKYFIPKKEGVYSIRIKFNIFIKNCSYMFNECQNIINIDLSSFETNNAIDMSYMFAYCYKLKNINLFSFNTENVTDMSYMFAFCHNLSSLDLSFFNTINVMNMNNMFAYCYILKDLNFSSFNTTKVTNMSYMFSNCENLIKLDLSYFDTQKVNDMSYMFSSCYKLTYIDLSNFALGEETNINGIFFPCSSLNKIKIKKEFFLKIKQEINSNIEIIS